MLDLAIGEENGDIAELTRSIGIDVLSPAARDAEGERAVPEKVWSTLFQTGLTVPVAEEFGGGGIPSALTQMVAVEGLAYGDAGIAMAAIWNGAAALTIGLCGPQQHEELLSRLASDPDARSAVALYEGFGRGPSEFATTIGANADGTWRIKGRKLAVPFAADADPLVIVGFDPAAGNLRAVVLAAGSAGVAVEPCNRCLALDAAPMATVTVDTNVPSNSLLGGPDADGTALAIAVGRLRLTVAAAAIGTAQRANDYAAQYSTERIAFGKPIAAFQGVSFMVSEAQIRIAAARLDVSRAASLLDVGDPAEEAVTRAVNYAGLVAAHCTRDAVQVLGGHGFITDHPVELWYRSAAALSALDFDPLRSALEPAL